MIFSRIGGRRKEISLNLFFFTPAFNNLKPSPGFLIPSMIISRIGGRLKDISLNLNISILVVNQVSAAIDYHGFTGGRTVGTLFLNQNFISGFHF